MSKSGDVNPHQLNYVTPPTVGKFMLDEHFVRLILGPVGSGKSAGCFMELLRRAKLQEPNAQGIRQTRMAIIRNTLQQLKQTCLADIQQWLSPIAKWHVSDKTVYVRFPLPDGTKVESDWLMIPLDSKEDQQRLLSLNLTGAWVSEFREIETSLISALSGRLGRFPAKAVAPCTWHGIVGESNPPDEDSEWYYLLEEDTPDNWGVYWQPSGLAPAAENVENLPPGYYDNLAEGHNEDWINVHVHAQYGKSLSGQAVFRASFRPDFHIVDEHIDPQEGVPVMIGQDFGRTPASLIGQVDNRGRLVIMQEVIAEDMGIEQFTLTKLRPSVYERFMGRTIFVVGDPTGAHKDSISEESPFDVMRKHGFAVFPAPTNDVDARVRAVEKLLLQQIDGGPALVISRAGCPNLCTAMKSQYRYRRKQTGDLEDRPEKNHPWSDLADDLQYMSLAASGGNFIGRVMNFMKPPPKRDPLPAGAWT